MPPFVKGKAPKYAYTSQASTDCVCRVKCVLIGDGAIGKTSLIVGYTTNGYPKEYVPTAYDNYSVIVNVNNKPVRLQICDTAGQDEFDALRPLCYPNTDVFLLCFSVVYPASFYNLAEKWIYEIRHHCPTTPVLLVGTQCDLRSDVTVLIELAAYHERPVSVQQAEALASKIGAITYVECSAITQRNLKEVFDAALLAALKTRRPDLVFSERPKKYTTKSSLSYKDGEKRGWKKFFCFL